MRIIDRTARRGHHASLASSMRSETAGPARQLVRAALVVATAASLAACAQSSAVRQARWTSPTKQADIGFRPPVQRAERAPEPVGRVRPAELGPPSTRSPSSGLASYYSEGQKTASGERFDLSELTAAHR